MMALHFYTSSKRIIEYNNEKREWPNTTCTFIWWKNLFLYSLAEALATILLALYRPLSIRRKQKSKNKIHFSSFFFENKKKNKTIKISRKANYKIRGK